MKIETEKKIRNVVDVTKGIATVITAACGLVLLFLNGSIRKHEDEIRKEKDRQREERRAERMAERQQNRENRENRGEDKGYIRKEDRI